MVIFMEETTSKAPQKPSGDRPNGNHNNKGGRHRNKRSRHWQSNQQTNAAEKQNAQANNTSGGAQKNHQNGNNHNRKPAPKPTDPINATEEISITTGVSDALAREAEEQDREADERGNELDLIIEAEQRQQDLLTANIPDVIPEGKTIIIGVRFRVGGKSYYFSPESLRCKVGQHVIVETARGL